MALAVPVYHSLLPLFSYGGKIVTPPKLRSRSHGIPIPIWEFSRSGCYCVNTPTVSIPELIQLLKGKSIILYFPPNATAGLATLDVRTPSLLPCPPARSIAIISFFLISPPLPSRSITVLYHSFYSTWTNFTNFKNFFFTFYENIPKNLTLVFSQDMYIIIW